MGRRGVRCQVCYEDCRRGRKAVEMPCSCLVCEHCFAEWVKHCYSSASFPISCPTPVHKTVLSPAFLKLHLSKSDFRLYELTTFRRILGKATYIECPHCHLISWLETYFCFSSPSCAHCGFIWQSAVWGFLDSLTTWHYELCSTFVKEMSQTELHTLLFRRLFLCPSLDSAYLTACLFCFFHLASAHNLPVSGNIQFATAQFLLRTKQLALLSQALGYGVIEDSQEVAVMLTAADLQAVHMEGLDMLYRLGVVEDLCQLLCEGKRYVELVGLLGVCSQQFIETLVAQSPDSSLTDALHSLLLPEKIATCEPKST